MRSYTRRSESGMTLLEILMASGMLTLIALALSQVVYDSSKASRGIALSNEFESLMTNVQQVITMEQTCRAFLQARLPGGLAPGAGVKVLNEVSLPAGPTIVRVTPVGEDQGLVIKRVELSNSVANLGFLPDGNQAFIVNLEIEAERIVSATNQKAAGFEKLIKTFPITVVSAPAAPNAIINCFQDPRVIDVCTALGGRANSNGVACDIGQEICRQLGGTYNAAAVPPCDYDVGVPPPLNFTERVCIDMGGTYMGMVIPACRFGANADTGGTSITAICTSMNGALVGGVPGKCDFCVANGGEWNAALNAGAGGCDFARRPCEKRTRPGFPAVYDPATQTCDSTAADCDRLGGVIQGTRCAIPIEIGFCSTAAGGHSYNIGTVGVRNGTYVDFYNWGCGDGWYVQNLSGFSLREENDDRDSWRAQVMCCRVTP